MKTLAVILNHNLPDETKGIKAPTDDGIILYNFKNKKQKLLVSLSEISEVEPNETMVNAEHYFNHISFCPFSSDFIFLVPHFSIT